MGSLSARQTAMLILLFVVTSVAFIVLDNQSALNPLKTGLRDLVNPITERAFDRINERHDREFFKGRAQVDAHVRPAALCVRRGRQATL